MRHLLPVLVALALGSATGGESRIPLGGPAISRLSYRETALAAAATQFGRPAISLGRVETLEAESTVARAGVERLIFPVVPHWRAVWRRRVVYGVSRRSIRRAALLLKFFGIVRTPTPLEESASLNHWISNELGRPIRMLLKDERQNPTGSFKDRSPIQLYTRVVKGRFPERVEAVSTGNHGKAVAHAVRVVTDKFVGLRGRILAMITMGKGTLKHKEEAILNEGGVVRRTDDNGQEIDSYASGQVLVRSVVRASQGRAIEIPHANRHVVSGYSTHATEILKQLNKKGVGQSVLRRGLLAQLYPLGSGGLFAGALEMRARHPGIMSFAVAADPASMTYDTLKYGREILRYIPSSDAIAVDGNMASPAPFAVPLIRDLATGLLKILDVDALYGAAVLARFGFPAEATSGMAVAALLLQADLFEKTQVFVAPLTSQNLSTAMRLKLQTLAGDPEGLHHYFGARRAAVEKAKEAFEKPLTLSA